VAKTAGTLREQPGEENSLDDPKTILDGHCANSFRSIRSADLRLLRSIGRRGSCTAGGGCADRSVGVPVVISICVDRTVGVCVTGTPLAGLFCAEGLENTVLVAVNGFVFCEGDRRAEQKQESQGFHG